MSSSVTARPCCVLVVEDDAILRLHTIDIVEEAGFTAIERDTVYNSFKEEKVVGG